MKQVTLGGAVGGLLALLMVTGAAADAQGRLGGAQGSVADRTPWVLLLGGASTDTLVGVAEAADGRSFFVTGSTLSHGAGGNDVRVARARADGRTLWELAVGGAGFDEPTSLVATPDGGCLVAGMTGSFGAGGLDGWLVRLGSDGQVLWQRTYGGAEDEAFASVALAPSGFYVGGTLRLGAVNADAWVLEIDGGGGVVWQETLPGENDDYVGSVAATPGGLVVVANSNSPLGGKGSVPFFRPWLVALDATGGILWQRTYDVSGGDIWSQIVPLADGGFVATGEVLAAAFFRGDAWIVRLDPQGDVLWERRFGDHFGPGFDGARQVGATRDGGFTMVGATETGGAGSQDLWLIHVSGGGELLWQRTYGGPGYDDGFGLAVAREGGLAVAGNAQLGFLGSVEGVLLRLDERGGTGAGCDLSGPTSPNIWSTPIVVGTGTIAPAPSAFASAASDARAAQLSTGALLCSGR